MDGEKTIWVGVRRGLASHCPTCGKGHLFAGYLKLRPCCDVCGADNTIFPSDDFPPYLTIMIVGHLLVPLFILVDRVYEPSSLLEALFWLPLATLLSLLLLPRMKGAAVGLCWATGLVRENPAG